MKKNRFIKHGACLSLMAMLPTMFGPSLMMQTVEAQTAPIILPIGGGLNTDDYYGQAQAEVLGFMTRFWSTYWGQGYLEGRSGMMLEPNATAPNAWDVQAVLLADPQALPGDPESEGQIVGTGVFMEGVRYSLMSEAGTLTNPDDGKVYAWEYDTEVVSGEMIGSTGWASPMHGFWTTFRFMENNPLAGGVWTETYSFAPEQQADTMTQANDNAYAVNVAINGFPHDVEEGVFVDGEPPVNLYLVGCEDGSMSQECCDCFANKRSCYAAARADGRAKTFECLASLGLGAAAAAIFLACLNTICKNPASAFACGFCLGASGMAIVLSVLFCRKAGENVRIAAENLCDINFRNCLTDNGCH